MSAVDRSKIFVLTGCRVFTIGQTNLTAYLQSLFGATVPSLIPIIEAAYPVGSNGLTNDYDAVAQVFTELSFQCVSYAVCKTVEHLILTYGTAASTVGKRNSSYRHPNVALLL